MGLGFRRSGFQGFRVQDSGVRSARVSALCSERLEGGSGIRCKVFQVRSFRNGRRLVFFSLRP